MNVSPAGGGAITSPQLLPPPTRYPSSYTCNANYTLTAVPDSAAGYKFERWEGSISSTDNPINVSVRDGAKSVTAIFAVKSEAVDLDGARDLTNSQPRLLILDVSSSADFSGSHMLCARNYPWNSGRNQFDDDTADLDPYKHENILIYDQTGARSKAAADYLAENGFMKMYYMTEGLNDWIAAGYDTFVPAEDADKCTSLAPMAYAGADEIVDEGVRVSLDGSRSADPAGGTLSYRWTQFKGSPAVALTNADRAGASFTSPTLTSGDAELVFHLTVTNDAGLKHTDSVIVNVIWSNDPPEADAGPNQSVAPGDLVRLDGSGSSDPEGQPLTYQWMFSSGNFTPTLSNPNSTMATFTAPDAGGWAEFILTVTDNGGKADTARTRVIVQSAMPENNPPEARARANPATTVEGTKVTLDGSESFDPDGDNLAYSWAQSAGPAVVLSSNTAPKPSFTAPTIPGNDPSTTLSFSLTVSDGKDTGSALVTVTVNKAVVNQPPTAVAAADKSSVSPGEKVTLDGSGSSDPDGAIAAYAWTQTDATGKTVTLSNPAAIKPTFTAPEITETITLIFKLTVTDNSGASASSTIRITVNKPSSGGGGGGGCFIHTSAGF